MKSNEILAAVTIVVFLTILLAGLLRQWRGLDDRGVARRLVGLQLCALLLATNLNRFGVPTSNLNDLEGYRRYALLMLDGQRPYRDFGCEYPPLALLVMAVPHLIYPGRLVDSRHYAILFGGLITLVSTLLALLLARIAPVEPGDRSSRAAAVYVALVILTLPVITGRFDLVPALLTQLGLVSVLGNRPLLAGSLLGAGIAAKLYPVLLLPVFALYYAAQRQCGSAARMLLGAALATGLIVLPFALVAGDHLLDFLRYHVHRGLQLETFPAGLVLLAERAGASPVELVFNFGAVHLQSPLAEKVLRWLPAVTVPAYGLVLLVALRRFRSERDKLGGVTSRSLVAALVAMLLVGLVTSKVFSPQYVLWLFPLIPLLRRPAELFIVAAALTTAIFPLLYQELVHKQLVPVLLLNVRNLLIAAIAFGIVVDLARSPRRVMLPEPGPRLRHR